MSSIIVYFVERMAVTCLALKVFCWINPLEKKKKRNWQDKQTGLYLLLKLASVIITNFLISVWKKQLISMEMRIGESSRADD